MSEGLRNTLLALHIVAACAWLGANFTQLFIVPTVAKASTDVRLWWAEGGVRLARVLYNAAGVVILVTGIALVIDSYSFASTFVSIGFAAVIIGAALGITVFAPKNRALVQAIRSGDTAEESNLRALIVRFAYLDTAIVIVTVFVMVWKVGMKLKGQA